MTNPEMPDPAAPRHVEVKEGDLTVAAAEVTTAKGPKGTARTSLHATSDHVRPGHRTSLVDAVMDLPEVQASSRLEATIPLGDGELLQRLRERTEDSVTRPAGSTALLDANIPPRRPPESLGVDEREPGRDHFEPPRQRRRGGVPAWLRS